MANGDSIVAQAADGTQHIFPAGTDPAVIDRAMEQYVLPQTNASNLSRNATETPFETRNKGGPGLLAKEALGGGLSGLGIAETPNPITDTAKNLADQAKTIGKFWTGNPDDIKASLAANPVVSVPGSLVKGFGTATDDINPFIDNFFRWISGKTGGRKLDPVPTNAGQTIHDVTSFGTQVGTLGLAKDKVPEAISDPIGKAGFQNVAKEVLNEGPSKARVLADQHAHALELQKHVAGVEQAVHTDAQQAMSGVLAKVDAAHPEGAFDKGDVGNRLNTAIGDTLSDRSQLPKSVRELLPKETSGKQLGPNIGGKTLDLAKPEDMAAYQKYKASGAFTPEEIANYEGKATGSMTAEELKQARSDLGKQMQRLEGPAKAAANAAYGEMSQMLREGAKAAGVEPDWIDANAKWKGYLDDFHRSPVQKTLFGENAHDIMEPLTGKSRVQVLDTLSKYEPFGMDMDRINQEVRRSGVTDTIQRLSRPTKMDLIIARLSPGGAALRAGVPRMLRSPRASDFLGGKGFEPETISPKKVYPNKAAAAADLKGNPTPFGGDESQMEYDRRSGASARKPLDTIVEERRSADKASAEAKRQAWEKAQEAKRKGDRN